MRVRESSTERLGSAVEVSVQGMTVTERGAWRSRSISSWTAESAMTPGSEGDVAGCDRRLRKE